MLLFIIIKSLLQAHHIFFQKQNQLSLEGGLYNWKYLLKKELILIINLEDKKGKYQGESFHISTIFCFKKKTGVFPPLPQFLIIFKNLFNFFLLYLVYFIIIINNHLNYCHLVPDTYNSIFKVLILNFFSDLIS